MPTALLSVALALALTLGMPASSPATTPQLPPTELVFENGGRIVSIKADGTDRKILTRAGKKPLDAPWDEDHDSDPQISPDGMNLIFIRHWRQGYRKKLMVADRDGSWPRPVFVPKETRRVDTEIYSPTFSKADGRIYFVRSSMAMVGKSKTKFRDDVVAMDIDGSGREVVLTRRMNSWTYKPMPGGDSIGSIDVSPDGKRLLVSGQGPGERQRVDVVNLVTGKSRTLFDGGDEARWSPDGTRVAFTSDHEKIGKTCDFMDGCSYDQQVYVINADGSGLRRLIPDRKPGFEAEPDWSEDGRRIAFYGDRNTAGKGGAEIYSVRTDGKCLTWLTNGQPSSTEPSWAPEGLDSSPPGCGPIPRSPLVEMKPLRKTPLWLGPIFGDSMLANDGGPGRGLQLDLKDPLDVTWAGLEYRGCSLFNPDECSGLSYDIGYAGICSKWTGGVLNRGDFVALSKRRGALVLRPRPFMGDLFGVLVFSGGHQLEISASGDRPVTWKQYLAVVDGLRPARSAGAVQSLPPAVLDRRIIRKARRIHRLVERSSVRSAAKQLDVKVNAVRAWTKFHGDLAAVGPVRTFTCRKADR